LLRSCESRSHFSFQLLSALPPLLSYLCFRSAYLFCPLGVYSSYHAPPPLATAFPISQPGNKPLLCNEILGQRLHLQRQCKMPAWLSQRYATPSMCHTRDVTNVHPSLSRASCRVTRTFHIAGTATPPYFSQHCGNLTSHTSSILPSFLPLRSIFDWARSCDSAFERPVVRSGLAINLLACISTSSLPHCCPGPSSLLPGCQCLYQVCHTLTVWPGEPLAVALSSLPTPHITNASTSALTRCELQCRLTLPPATHGVVFSSYANGNAFLLNLLAAHPRTGFASACKSYLHFTRLQFIYAAALDAPWRPICRNLRVSVSPVRLLLIGADSHQRGTVPVPPLLHIIFVLRPSSLHYIFHARPSASAVLLSVLDTFLVRLTRRIQSAVAVRLG
jgi:hypothetical protein